MNGVYPVRGYTTAISAYLTAVESWDRGDYRDALYELMTSFPALPMRDAVSVLRGSRESEADQSTLTVR